MKYNKIARSKWPNAAWISGEGQFALLAYCDVLTVSLWETIKDAEKNKKFIDEFGCGGMCNRIHEILTINI